MYLGEIEFKIDLTVGKKTSLTRLKSKVLSLVKLWSIPYSHEPSPKSLISCT